MGLYGVEHEDEELGSLLTTPPPPPPPTKEGHQGPEGEGSAAALGPSSSSSTVSRSDKTKFLVVLAFYVAPLGAAIWKEGVYYGPNHGQVPQYVAPTFHPFSFGLWLLVCLALYGAQRGLASSLRWKRHDFGPEVHKETVFRLGYLGALVCFAGRVGARLDATPVAFSGLVAAYTLAYDVLFELIKHSNIEFTREWRRNTSTLALLALSSVLVGALVVNHFSNIQALEAQDGVDRTLPTSLCILVVVVVYHAALALVPGAHAHFHHWYSGFLGANFCVFNSDVSRISQAMLLGIYLHGAALFGVEQCFYADKAGS